MYEVDPTKDKFGRAITALLDEFGVESFVLAGMTKESKGVSMSRFKDAPTALVVLSLLLLNEAPITELWFIAMLRSYLDELGGKTSPADGFTTLLKDESFVKTVKF